MATFELTFRPGVTTKAQVNDKNVLFYAAHHKSATIPDQTRVITDALANPIGAPRLDGLLHAGQSVVVLFDDITRPTPTAQILPHILRTISQSGIPDSSVTLFASMGTHRPMTEEELSIKLGDDVRRRYRVINRDYRYADFVSLGTTASGAPVFVDRAVVEADVKIAIGNVVPHISAGWGGRIEDSFARLLQPGDDRHDALDGLHCAASARSDRDAR